MSLYKKCTVARLQSICEERNISHAECKTKKQLSDALTQNDLRRDQITQEVVYDRPMSTMMPRMFVMIKIMMMRVMMTIMRYVSNDM